MEQLAPNDYSEQGEDQPDREVQDRKESRESKQVAPGLPVAAVLDLTRAIGQRPLDPSGHYANYEDKLKCTRPDRAGDERHEQEQAIEGDGPPHAFTVGRDDGGVPPVFAPAMGRPLGRACGNVA